jgi:hypothetical protein
VFPVCGGWLNTAAMRRAMEERLMDVVTPFLEGGEQPIMSTCATMGAHSVGTITRGAVRQSVSTLGTSFTLHMPKRFFLVLTNRRLLFVDSHESSGRPLPHVAAHLPRHGLRLTPLRGGGLMKCFHVTAPDGRPITQVNFAMPQRGDAARLATVLNG